MADEHILPPDTSVQPPRPGASYRDRERPKRRPLVPASTWIVLGIALIAVALVAAGVAYTVQVRTVEVPDVTGLSSGAAQSELRQAGFSVRIAEERFSLEPKGTVLDQTPEPGTEAKTGDEVSLVVSEGSEEFAMPDVVGDGLQLATGKLKSLGLDIAIEVEPSDLPSDTVLASNPGPGTTVRTGDLVRLTVASTRTVDPGLQSYKLEGVVVTLDPGPGKAGDVDATLEVARRLRALLEASGAGVVVTRSGIDTAGATSVDVRAKRASESTPVVLVGLDAPSTGAVGRGVTVPATGEPARLATSRLLASALASTLAGDGALLVVTTTPPDAVQRAVAAPSARIRLGSYGSREDLADFRDPRWADMMARAIYRALGQQFGAP